MVVYGHSQDYFVIFISSVLFNLKKLTGFLPPNIIADRWTPLLRTYTNIHPYSVSHSIS